MIIKVIFLAAQSWIFESEEGVGLDGLSVPLPNSMSLCGFGISFYQSLKHLEIEYKLPIFPEVN